MREELEKQLEEDFPFMKKGKSYNAQKEEGRVYDLYSAFGLQCGDGWYELIHDMCSEIMDEHNKTGQPVDLVVDQVKEKFGTLRFYYHFEGEPRTIHATDFIGSASILMPPERDEFKNRISEIVKKYREKSAYTCEKCGAPGKLRNDLDYILTLCDEHYGEAKTEE